MEVPRTQDRVKPESRRPGLGTPRLAKGRSRNLRSNSPRPQHMELMEPTLAEKVSVLQRQLSLSEGRTSSTKSITLWRKSASPMSCRASR